MLVKKKPVEVQAHQWFKNGDHPDDHVGKWVPTGRDNWHDGYTRKEGAVVGYFNASLSKNSDGRVHKVCGTAWQQHGWVDTLEGGHIVCPSDWIITGIKGEYYPIKNEIFLETYEEVDNG